MPDITPTKEKGQRSLELPVFLTRILPQWTHPDWLMSKQWRSVVLNQPVAMACQETLIQNVLSLDWQIHARDSTQKDELKSRIDEYTQFFEHTGEIDYSTHVEWVLKDMLTLPFGGCSEFGREGDGEKGMVRWIRPVDAGTLFPTLNHEWPVGQYVPEVQHDPVFFPKHTINRIYTSPRTEIRREGWGMAPPEKIYLALQMLFRGDTYYANLLLDTPEAGLLYLGNIDKASAEDWAAEYRSLMNGIDPLKVPILYETEAQPKWIPFGRSPTEMILDKQTVKYAALICAGYGMSLSDIGFQAVTSGGETLAGSIRQERRTRKSGIAILKKKIVAYFNFLLPKELRFHLIDYDDELNVAKGRARLASATAAAQLIKDGVFGPGEMRRQMIADGLITISVPENLPDDEKEAREELMQSQNGNNPAERPNQLGRPVPVSAGGQGEETA